MFQPMMLYQIKNCVIDLYKCKKFEKAEFMTPFHKSGDDDWQDAKGNFKIIIDDISNRAILEAKEKALAAK